MEAFMSVVESREDKKGVIVSVVPEIFAAGRTLY
jgi:hypothetical protein